MTNNSELSVKETSARMQQKITELEEELNEAKVQRDKLKTSLEYCRGVIETKNAVTSILEEKLKNSEGLRHSKSFSKEVLKIVTGIKELIRCGVCANVAEFSVINCEHLVCSACLDLGGNCPVCSISGKLCSLPVFRKISKSICEIEELGIS